MSRAIDNYTDKEREILALKGMTAPRTASEKNYKGPYRTLDGTPSLPCKPAPNKAQPRTANERVTPKSVTHEYVRNLERHADKLAGALRNALNMIDPFVWDKSKEASILDAYEKESK